MEATVDVVDISDASLIMSSWAEVIMAPPSNCAVAWLDVQLLGRMSIPYYTGDNGGAISLVVSSI
jgi:hypothetical protein